MEEAGTLEPGALSSDEVWGQIYALGHPWMPGLIKIGFTTGSIRDRIKALRSEALPGDFSIVHNRRCFNPRAVERLIHEQLKERRVLQSREFFKIDEGEVTEAIDAVIDGAVGPVLTPCTITTLDDLGCIVRRQRLAKKISMDELASRSGITRPTQAAIELNNGNVKIKTIMNVLDNLDLKLTIVDKDGTDLSKVVPESPERGRAPKRMRNH